MYPISLADLPTGFVQAFERFDDLEFAALVGSRATGRFRPDSDWDIAIRWQRGLSASRRLDLTESLRLKLAATLSVVPEQVDLIDLALARLAMRALVAEEGVVLHGGEALPWLWFLQTTWADIEDFHWRQRHAA